MKATYLRQAYMGAIGDTKNLEIHFANMAEQGWMIDKIGVFFHRYRACEPVKKRFFVDFLPQITAFDYPENEDAQDYRRICEDSGWTFLMANKQIHIYCADENTPDPTPIHTDNKIQAQIHLKMSRKYELPHNILPMLLFGFILSVQFSYNGMEVFLSNLMIFQLLGTAFLLVGYLWTLGFMLSWYWQTRKSAKYGLPMPVVNYRLSRIRGRVFAVGIIVFMVCLPMGMLLEILGGMPARFLLFFILPFSGLGVGLWIRKQIDTKRRGRKTNIAMTVTAIAVMQVVILGGLIFGVLGTLPNQDMAGDIGNRPALTLSSIGIEAEPEFFGTRIRGSVAVPIHYSFWESNIYANVSTDVYRPINTLITRGLYNRFVYALERNYGSETFARIWGRNIEVSRLTIEEAALWGADEGVVAFNPIAHTTELILRNGRTILHTSIHGEGISMDAKTEAVRSLFN